MGSLKQVRRQPTDFYDEEIDILNKFVMMCENRKVQGVVKVMYEVVMESPTLQKEILSRYDFKKGTLRDRRKN